MCVGGSVKGSNPGLRSLWGRQDLFILVVVWCGGQSSGQTAVSVFLGGINQGLVFFLNILFLVRVGGAVSQGIEPRSLVSLGAPMPFHTNFGAGGRSIKRSNRGLRSFWGCQGLVFVLNILILVFVWGRSVMGSNRGLLVAALKGKDLTQVRRRSPCVKPCSCCFSFLGRMGDG